MRMGGKDNGHDMYNNPSFLFSLILPLVLANGFICAQQSETL